MKHIATIVALVLYGNALAADSVTTPFPVAEAPVMSRDQALAYLHENRVAIEPDNLVGAVMNGNAKLANALLSAGVDANAKGGLPQSPLQLASLSCAGGRVKSAQVVQMMDLLLDHGARVNEPGMGGLNALFVAVQNCSPDVVRRLIKGGADLNARTPQGFTPLSMALIVENYDAADVLITSGARLSAEAAKNLMDGEEKNARLAALVKRARAK